MDRLDFASKRETFMNAPGPAVQTLQHRTTTATGRSLADGTAGATGSADGARESRSTQPTASIGEEFTYRITVPNTPYLAPLYDVRILDDLGASAANLTYVNVMKVSGGGTWSPVNTGDATNLVIEDTTQGIDILPGQQVVLDITVRVDDTPTNVAGLTFQ